ncbi:hypothetical protein GCM10023201_11380 [Actinomycetospora corticicola]|uniref:Uncharacterized protein n=1 Tax=Actinomycetospora corticicola TaxID=663602 RepID=A0A7Y9DTA1_9PSEU|nr:hypothetical protein [Actinomycetospora corticicola]NYD35025.1 hypothetical protein [Actinomycetospora corticicola]
MAASGAVRAGSGARKKSQHETNKRMIVETTAWITAIAAALTVGLQAAISATASAPDVPRVTPLEYQYTRPQEGPLVYTPFTR